MKFNFKRVLAIVMLDKQQDFNNRLNEEWFDEEVCKRDDALAMDIELSEFIEHIGFKWWKKEDSNTTEAKMELIDVYHFLMSYMVRERFSLIYQAFNRVLDDVDRNEVYELAKEHVLFMLMDNAKRAEISVCSLNNEHRLSQEEIKSSIIGITKDLKMALYREDLDAQEQENHNLRKPLMYFFMLTMLMGMTFEDIYLMYIGKNVLNRFRQDHGYKTGKYIKLWGVEQEEDNVYLNRYLDTLRRVDTLERMDVDAAVYKYLESNYPKKAA